MSIPTPLADPTSHPADDGDSDLAERINRVEAELAELRHTLSELAEIVVGDIKDRRETALAMSAPVPDVPIPPSLDPGGQTVLTAVNAARRPWLLFDFLREMGTAVRMYMDARYRLRRSTQFLVPLLVGLFIANYLFFNALFVHIPVVSPVLERLVVIVLAVVLYKVLSREVARYRQMLAQIAFLPRAWKPVPASLLNTDPDTAPLTRHESP
ncbi:MAG: hypothetical protein J2P46_11695 [Zavarzinella sp.]|nr:hypothetical protein [Zavarzinella sp.]